MLWASSLKKLAIPRSSSNAERLSLPEMEVVSDRLSRGGELSMEYLADEEEVKRARDAAMRVVRCMLDVGVCVCVFI